MKVDGITVTYDEGRTKFMFSPSIRLQDATTCKKVLGIPSWYPLPGYPSIITESIQPINMSTIQQINIESNLSINNVPVSGRLLTVPVLESYSELINYYDPDGTYKSHCLDHILQRIEIRLTDEQGNPLASYLETLSGVPPLEYPSWYICLAVDEITNDGFENLSSIDSNVQQSNET